MLLRLIQLVQNFSARLILNRNKFCHITVLLYELHWLPIDSRIKFKVLLFIYISLNGLAPSYFSDLLHLYEPTRSLRSSNKYDLVVPRFNRNCFGGCAFSVCGPNLWKDLPYEIKSASSIDSFKNKLKTHLFSKHFDSLIF